MKYVSIAKSRAGWKPDTPPKKAAKSRKPAHTETPVEQSAANTNPDGGEPATNPEEGSA